MSRFLTPRRAGRIYFSRTRHPRRQMSPTSPTIPPGATHNADPDHWPVWACPNCLRTVWGLRADGAGWVCLICAGWAARGQPSRPRNRTTGASRP
jgi:hypothetical protein